MPRSLTQPGLGDALTDAQTARQTFLVQQMHALSLALAQARQRNDKVDGAALLKQFRALADEYTSEGAALDASAYNRVVLEAGNWINGAVDALPNAIAALPKAIGAGLIQAAIPFVVLAGAYLLLRREFRK